MHYNIHTNYQGRQVVYEASSEDGDVFHLRLQSNNEGGNETYIPEKIVIRKKGKLWVSDIDNYPELVDKLIVSISSQQFSVM